MCGPREVRRLPSRHSKCPCPLVSSTISAIWNCTSRKLYLSQHVYNRININVRASYFPEVIKGDGLLRNRLLIPTRCQKVSTVFIYTVVFNHSVPGVTLTLFGFCNVVATFESFFSKLSLCVINYVFPTVTVFWNCVCNLSLRNDNIIKSNTVF